jgi:hypothetical protein
MVIWSADQEELVVGQPFVDAIPYRVSIGLLNVME